MTAPSPSSAEPSSWAVTWLFCTWKTCTCPGGLSSFWVLRQPCLSLCLNCLCAQHCISWHGIPVHLFFLSEIWFAKTNKCKSGVPRKKHFCKGPALCVCVREREDFGSNTLSQHCFFVVALFSFFCFLQNTGGVFFLHTVQSLILTQLLWFGMNYMYPCCIYIYMTWAHINSSCCTEDEWDSSRAVLGRQPSYAKWRHTAW